MKILTGDLRGRPIFFKPNPHLRPTPDKVRKAVFDALQGLAEGRRVLDLFSGTGALGFEALSNGARHVTFVESDKAQAKRIGENAEKLGLGGRCLVFVMDAAEAVGRFGEKSMAFDWVFLDPPYAKDLGFKTMEKLSESGILNREALVVWECGKKEEGLESFKNLKRVKSKIYGDTQIAFYRLA